MEETEKTSVIKNPLTIIAIFAGIAEASGTIVLPFIEPSNQELFIWFLMIFPFVLVLLFFATLNWNHKVLYAPSDFQDEQNFVDILTQPTVKESLSSIVRSTYEIEQEKDEDPSSREERKTEIIEQVKNDSSVRNLLALYRLEQELKVNIIREKVLQYGEARLLLDGFSETEESFFAIDVRTVPKKKSYNYNSWQILKFNLEHKYDALKSVQHKEVIFYIIILTSENQKEMQAYVQRQLESTKFKLIVKAYTNSDLEETRNSLSSSED